MGLRGPLSLAMLLLTGSLALLPGASAAAAPTTPVLAPGVATVTSSTARTLLPGATPDAEGVTIYMFWGEGCPHCAAAKPFLADLAERYPGVVFRDFEVWYHPENQEPLAKMAAKFGFDPTGVPVIFIGDDSWTGFSEEQNGREIETVVAACVESGCPDAGAGILAPPFAATTAPTPSATAAPSSGNEDGTEDATEAGGKQLSVPLLGTVDLGRTSLVVSTSLIAFVDGFNPCSLWVLSVLLALTLHSGSRRKTLIIGLVFITVTALVYALFIAGLFTVFTMVSFTPWIRAVVALVAAVFAIINIKDYFWYKEGISFTINDEKKPGIYRSMRRVVASGDSLPALVGATIVMAAGVSLVEFSCTAGFPVLWTNLLADQGVGAVTFVLLLLLYLLIYQADELVIFGVAVVTLRASKMQEKQGRILKLIGGMLMLTLAVVMIVNPAWMNDVGTSVLVFAIAFAGAMLVLLVHRVVLPRFGIVIGTEDREPAAVGPGKPK